jgi:5-formyltetrahydrofolate cyclo-ligase
MDNVSDFSPSGMAKVPSQAVMKRALRAKQLSARRSMPASERQRADQAIAAALAPLVRGKIVTGYVAMPGEPGGPELLEALSSAARLLLPVLRDDQDLDWASYAGALVPAARGLREPPGPRLGVDTIASVEVVVVPAVAVDKGGMRLGRGGGSYDRALARARSAQIFAVIYAADLVDEVPAEPHDQRVHGAVTPSGLWYAA